MSESTEGPETVPYLLRVRDWIEVLDLHQTIFEGEGDQRRVAGCSCGQNHFQDFNTNPEVIRLRNAYPKSMSERNEEPETAPIPLNIKIVTSDAVPKDTAFLGPQEVFDKARRGDEITEDDARRIGVLGIIDDPTQELPYQEKFTEWARRLREHRDWSEDSSFGKVLCVNASHVAAFATTYDKPSEKPYSSLEPCTYLAFGKDAISWWLAFDDAEDARAWWDVHEKNVREQR